MKFTFMFFLALLTVSCCTQKKKIVDTKINPQIAFIVTEGILHPESALYSQEHQAIFISNITSGDSMEKKEISYISKLSKDGKIIKSKWVTGLRAPKGMAIVKNHLFVSDVNRIIKIDINTAKIVKKINVTGAKFLNDVVADSKGNVYVSDMFDNAIYVLNEKGLNTFVKTTDLRSPNGLYIDSDDNLIVALWGSEIDMKTFHAKSPGKIAQISLNDKDKKITEMDSLVGHLDGIDTDKDGSFWISDWISGDIYRVSKNYSSVDKVFNFGQGTADISVMKDEGIMLVPQMMQNKIVAIKL